jgi:3-deoxy-7-phosphoheptulonate synthase
MIRTDDLRIVQTQPLITPAVLCEELPHSDGGAVLVHSSRRTIEAILHGADRRLLCIVGPCSVHDPAAALDYAQQMQLRTAGLGDALFIVMRVYFEKPRTVVGWKGLINDPDLDGSFHINKGLHLARRLLLDVTALGLPAATEFLDTTFGQYYADLISFGAIGARTVESQVHRELASGLSMPVGIKNRTDGDVGVAIDAIRAAAHPHWFPSITKEGSPAILRSSGNPHCCLILRGGNVSGPNFGAAAVNDALERLQDAGLEAGLVVDCSHGNSGKDPARQTEVASDLASQIRAGQRGIRGVMIESHLHGGTQTLGPRATLRYGQSVTDACLSLEATLPLLEQLAGAVRTGR